MVAKTSSKRQAEMAERQRRSNQNDAETEAMIFQGANITQIAKLFHMDRRDVTPKILDVPQCGTRGGYPIYFIHEVAPHLVKPIYDIETYIKRMHHNDLPKHLTKEFWAGALAKQKYEEEAGDLWRTDEVVEKLGGVFKKLRMTMLLMGDAIERETTFTDKQRDMLSAMVDGALNKMADSLVHNPTVKNDEEEDL